MISAARLVLSTMNAISDLAVATECQATKTAAAYEIINANGEQRDAFSICLRLVVQNEFSENNFMHDSRIAIQQNCIYPEDVHRRSGGNSIYDALLDRNLAFTVHTEYFANICFAWLECLFGVVLIVRALTANICAAVYIRNYFIVWIVLFADRLWSMCHGLYT